MIGASVIAAGLALIWLGESDIVPPLGRGAAAPDFSLAGLDGGQPIGLSDYQGRVVLVNFWATWCKPCEDEMPSMERLYQALHPDGFELVAISVDGDAALVRAFRERLGISFPIALDPEMDVSRLYQTTGFPESLLVDSRGIIIERYVGPRDWRFYRDRIRKLMSDS